MAKNAVRAVLPGILLCLMLVLAVLTCSHSYYVCSDCGVIRESYDVFGLPVIQWKIPTRLTELLDRFGENPRHSHRFEMASLNTFNLCADGEGGILIRRINALGTMDFLENMYRFEDRKDARRWREELMGPGKSNYRFGEVLSSFSDSEIPKDETAWRRWWGNHGAEFERAVFPRAATNP